MTMTADRVGAPSPVLELEGVSKEDPGPPPVLALSGVDLVVEPGEFVAIVGPSGSGKSTLLNLLGALDRCTAGRVRVDGTDLSELDDRGLSAVRGRKIGFVFQNFNLLDGLSAVDNVGLGLIYDGVAKAERHRRAGEALERVGMAHRADHRPSRLSGGERQRVAIARSIVGERRLLLADEPSGALDSVNGEAVMRLIRNACRGDVAGVVVTHDAQLAAWADRVVFLRDGRLVDATVPAPGPESLLAPGPGR